MTPTQHYIRRHLALMLGGLSLVGCQESNFCIAVTEEEECPSVEEVNEEHMPTSDCGGPHLRAKEFDGRSETLGYMGYSDTGPNGSFDNCCYVTASRKTLARTECIEGRPLLHDGQVVTARVCTPPERSPWCEAAEPDCRGLSRQERERLAKYWLHVALLEHASVASFNHFSIGLMRFGAPPRLLLRAQHAAQDEVLHARMAFALASGYLGQDMAPSGLRFDPQQQDSLVSFAESVAREAAINESLAVVMAAAQYRQARDPAVKRLLHHIITDESRHAELAWDTLRWCIKHGGEPVAIRLQAVFEEGFAPDLDAFPLSGVPEHGLADRQWIRQALLTGWREVILPSARSIMEIGRPEAA
jgi:hypothetical protein